MLLTLILVETKKHTLRFMNFKTVAKRFSLLLTQILIHNRNI